MTSHERCLRLRAFDPCGRVSQIGRCEPLPADPARSPLDPGCGAWIPASKSAANESSPEPAEYGPNAGCSARPPRRHGSHAPGVWKGRVDPEGGRPSEQVSVLLHLHPSNEHATLLSDAGRTEPPQSPQSPTTILLQLAFRWPVPATVHRETAHAARADMPSPQPPT